MKNLSGLVCFVVTLAVTSMASAASYTLSISTDKTSYSPGQTMNITAIFKKDSTGITSPSKREVRIKDSSGSTLVQTSMSNAGSGKYTYAYKLSSSAKTGKYEVRGDFISGSNEVKSYSYPQIATSTADTTAPVTSVSPAGGTYTTAQSVKLTANEAATIYYTTNGSTPTTVSAVYSAPLTISATTTLKYFARDTAGNVEAVKTATYTISTAGGSGPHAGLTYTGTTMCLQCHTKQATDLATSAHYKWETPYAAISNKPGVTGGKLNTAVNAYCINTLGNFNGCGGCHIGAGAKPGTVADATQNIDCLVCHQVAYKRVRNATTGLFEPDTVKMTISMDQAVQTLHKPVKSNCLQCHAKGGGGDALKRGDLALINGTTTDRNYDVHMASTGANLTCQQCHTYTNHHVAGRGSDLRPTDSTVTVSCATSSCHSNKAALNAGHATTAINTHLKRVACQTCHIPSYGRKAADAVLDTVTGFGDQSTETDRTWVTPEWSVANNRWEPTVVRANNLKPVYAFFDGTSWVYDLHDVAVKDPATGNYKISRPNGGINTANTKLYPFKYKTSTQPMHTASGKLIALNTSVYFKTADVAGAIQSGMTNMGLNPGDAYSMVKADEYQMLNHTVAPKANALQCAACHGTTSVPATQMNLKSMGYALKAAQSVVCTQCHGNESLPSFTSLHSKHVTSEKIDCSMCHTFSRAAERGLTIGIKH
ncbi:chitobiase/beta-hexosaminidase C-terminal domain-containing protein [Trichlorobacter lovleyi]|uniref:chitobiase/beta-hexosaminidase C-terminal domain-containing protein n=1 Tax=Trichlorobacter lovleyi TaxID=313985 RepID=UPI0022406444|nr:chitobiase/beta-hexosaminidase C-terminal domain-containing protein [Trichlorobacter lovleyi]QOX78520.1 chitobiase/beta-hexosaminidase C-terminal domain-containing protein [Trichlorobacter lovleyi]